MKKALRVVRRLRVIVTALLLAVLAVLVVPARLPAHYVNAAAAVDDLERSYLNASGVITNASMTLSSVSNPAAEVWTYKFWSPDGVPVRDAAGWLRSAQLTAEAARDRAQLAVQRIDSGVLPELDMLRQNLNRVTFKNAEFKNTAIGDAFLGVPTSVWSATVQRSSGPVTALQELADTKTAAQANSGSLQTVRNTQASHTTSLENIRLAQTDLGSGLSNLTTAQTQLQTSVNNISAALSSMPSSPWTAGQIESVMDMSSAIGDFHSSFYCPPDASWEKWREQLGSDDLAREAMDRCQSTEGTFKRLAERLKEMMRENADRRQQEEEDREELRKFRQRELVEELKGKLEEIGDITRESVEEMKRQGVALREKLDELLGGQGSSEAPSPGDYFGEPYPFHGAWPRASAWADAAVCVVPPAAAACQPLQFTMPLQSVGLKEDLVVTVGSCRAEVVQAMEKVKNFVGLMILVGVVAWAVRAIFAAFSLNVPKPE